MTELLSGGAGALITDLSTYLVYIAIVALFIVCLMKCVAPVVNTRRVLRRAVREIKQGENSKHSWQEETFLGKGPLYPHWSEYLNNLFFADGEFHNPSNVEDFINEDTAVYGPGRAQFAEAAPGIMVSLGFLGTLTGISMGLSGFDMSDAEKVMSAIRRLVPSMQYAFTTSIVGVIGSIGITLITRIADGAACRALEDFYAAMNRHAGVLSVDPMTQIAIYQQEQTALIQNMARDISGAVTERMAQAMGTAVTTSLNELKGSLDDFTMRVAREQLHGVDMMVARFVQQLNASMDGSFARLKQTLEETSRCQETMSGNVQRSMEGIVSISKNIISVAQASDGLLTKYDDYLAKLSQTAKLAEEGYARIASNVEHLEIIARQQNGYLQSVGKLQEKALLSLSDFETARDRFMNRFAEQEKLSAQSLKEITDEMKRSGDVLALNHRALVGGISKDIDRAYNTFFKTTNETIEHMSWAATDIKESIAAMPDTIAGTGEMLAREADRMGDTLRHAQAALDEAIDRLTKAMYTKQ